MFDIFTLHVVWNAYDWKSMLNHNLCESLFAQYSSHELLIHLHHNHLINVDMTQVSVIDASKKTYRTDHLTREAF